MLVFIKIMSWPSSESIRIEYFSFWSYFESDKTNSFRSRKKSRTVTGWWSFSFSSPASPRDCSTLCCHYEDVVYIHCLIIYNQCKSVSSLFLLSLACTQHCLIYCLTFLVLMDQNEQKAYYFTTAHLHFLSNINLAWIQY